MSTPPTLHWSTTASLPLPYISQPNPKQNVILEKQEGWLPPTKRASAAKIN